MEFKTLLAKVAVKLEEDKRGDLAKMVPYCENERELRSFLRERIFKNDAKVLDFLNKIREEDKAKIFAKETLSEAEVSNIIFDGLTTFFSKKNSKFKITKHWRTMDKDVCFCIEDGGGNESEYRFIVLRT
jgi:hypothetical protein